MILETLYAFALFVLIISILPLGFLMLRSYARSKRGVIEGLARLEPNVLRRLGCEPAEYIGTFDLSAPFRLGWQSWGLLVQQQNVALQRVLLHGLPNSLEFSEETRKSVRRFRRYFCALFVLGAVVVFLPAYYRLSRILAEFTGVSTSIWYILFGLCIGSLVFLPPEKFRKWPEIGEAT